MQSSDKIWAELIAGNDRFVTGETLARDVAAERARTYAAQKPLAAVLGCADSRVVPELVFDQAIGALFVIRTSGHCLDDAVRHSLGFAVEELEIPLVVVLGHTGCAAIRAAALGSGGNGSKRWIRDQVTGSLAQGMADDPRPRAAVEVHADVVARHLAALPTTEARVRRGELRVRAAVYDLESGRVTQAATA